jgi:hypothetical protein
MKSKHVFFLGIAVGLLTAIALAGGATAEETKNVTGTVKTASDDSLTITVDEKDWTFVIDKDTKVVAKDAEMMGGKTKFTDFVKAKQKVTVSYHETEDKLHAAEVRIL